MRIFSKKLLLATFFFGLALGLAATNSDPANALSGSEFKAGRIIDDAYFYNGSTMSASDIQNFLNSKVSSCDTWGNQPYGGTTRAAYGTSKGYPPPYTCLKEFRQDTGYKPGESGLCSAIEAKSNRTAAQIIDDVAQACHISQKVILVMLQKEQGLVTDDWPWSIQYRSAMGYGCPDTAACDSEYYGFFNQVYNAARQFQRYKADPNNWNHVPFMTNNVLYQANAPSCGSRSVYIENYATAGLYNYTPYTPNTAALNNLYGSGDSCSAYGNRNFWRYYNDWFGATQTPTTFRPEGSSTVYVMVGGYKVAIPAMYTLQDYGYDPAAISVISQSSNNLIPTPPAGSGISSTLGHVIKSTSDSDADGGAVYFVSVGYKYPVSSMEQFNNFGFSVPAITYLPLSYIQTLSAGPSLFNFVRTPDGAIFNVNATQKKLIFSNETHTSINPSGNVTSVSAGTASLIATGNPYSDNKAVFLKRSSNDAVYAYNNDTYYAVSADSYDCWGVGILSDRTLRVLNPEYLPTSLATSGQIDCLYGNGQGGAQALNKTKRYSVPSEYGISNGLPIVPDQLTYLYNNTPLNSAPLQRAVKSPGSNTVWYLEGGTKRPVPSMSNFYLLGATNQLDLLEIGVLKAITSGPMKLGNGQAVKTPMSSAVFIVNSASRYAVESPDQFNALRQRWDNIETYDPSLLDASYPISTTQIKPYLFVSSLNKTYLLDVNDCYLLSPGILASYGKNQDDIRTAQRYESSIAPYVNFNDCKVGSEYIRSDSSGTVYRLESGTKHAISSWNKLIEMNGGSAPAITVLTPPRITEFPTGTTY